MSSVCFSSFYDSMLSTPSGKYSILGEYSRTYAQCQSPTTKTKQR